MKIRWQELRASDLQARARSVDSLVKAGVEVSKSDGDGRSFDMSTRSSKGRPIQEKAPDYSGMQRARARPGSDT